MARINLNSTIDQVEFSKPVWDWLDLLGDMLVITQREAIVHEGYVVDDPFKRLMVFGTNRIIKTLNSIYILLRCEYIDLAAAQIRILSEALITLVFVAKEPTDLARKFWSYYEIEAFETASTMVELERGRAKPEHVRHMEVWLDARRSQYEQVKPNYTYTVNRGKGKGKSRPYINWCNKSVAMQAECCGAELSRLYRLVYKQMSAYVHCSAFSLRRQVAYTRVHYNGDVVHRDIATLVRTTGVVWIEISKFLSLMLGWNMIEEAAQLAKEIELLDERQFESNGIGLKD